MLLIALPTTIPCKLCLPCITPPCYKQEPGVSYTTNPFAGVPGDTIMTHLTHFVQFDAHAPRAASSFFVLLANGTREYVEPPNATLANATASNATAALPRLLPRRTLGPA